MRYCLYHTSKLKQVSVYIQVCSYLNAAKKERMQVQYLKENMSSSVIIIVINQECFPWEKPVLRDTVYKDIDQFFHSQNNLHCFPSTQRSSFVLQISFRPFSDHSIECKHLGGFNNAENFERKNVLKENIAVIVEIPYKYGTNRYFKVYQGVR